jgi:hypothetical protein
MQYKIPAPKGAGYRARVTAANAARANFAGNQAANPFFATLVTAMFPERKEAIIRIIHRTFSIVLCNSIVALH